MVVAKLMLIYYIHVSTYYINLIRKHNRGLWYMYRDQILLVYE
jgi:hypothetical protein